MFEKILVPVDGSEHSAQTLPVALDMARRYGAEVIVLHVREHEKSWAADVEFTPSEDAQRILDETLAMFHGAGIPATGEIRRVVIGLAPREIVDVAEQHDVKLIVMGNRGMTQWRGLVLGSVAHKVLHHATCPVLLVR